MKRVFAGMLLTVLFVAVDSNAGDFYSTMQTRLRVLGEKVEKTEVPFIDNLANLLPFGMVAACLKEAPGQTMMVLTGLLVYILCANDKFRSALRKYSPFKGAKRVVKNETHFDDSLFVFEGDGQESLLEEIAEEILLQEEIAQEMIQDAIDEEIFEEGFSDEDVLFFDEYSDFSDDEEIARSRFIKFL